MNGLLEAARHAVPELCRAKKFLRVGCSVTLEGIDEDRIIADMDCCELDIPEGRKRCDFVFVGQEVWVAPIELKRGNVEAKEVIEQLKTGATFAHRKIVQNLDGIHFQPVVVYGGRIHISQREKLKKQQNKIKFQDRLYVVKLIRCGSPLKLAFQ